MTKNHDITTEQPTPSAESGSPGIGKLHEFQSRLLERISVARDNEGMLGNRLGVMIGNRRCLLDLRETEEIARLLPIFKVPLTKDWYLGLANVRGNLIGVVDLDCFLCGEKQMTGKHSRIIVVSSMLCAANGFLVSRVLGLHHLQTMALAQHEKGSAMFEAGIYHDADGNEWTEISLARIVRDPRFLHVGLLPTSSAARD